MDMPGLLPEEGAPRRSPLGWILGILVLLFLLAIGLMAVQLVRLKGERDKFRTNMDDLLAQMRRPAPAPRAEPSSLARRVEELEARLAQAEAARRAEPAAVVAAPAVREAAAAPARSVETEAMIYVHVSVGFAGRGLYPEAVRALGEALRLDPAASWRVRPRALFSSPEEFERLMAELERRVKENPLDAEARTVLAYLVFHEKGPDAARVHLHQVLAANPDHAVAKKLLEELEK